jgi:hypothetical protein
MATTKCGWCHTIKEVAPVEDNTRKLIVCPDCMKLLGVEWLPQPVRYKTLEDFKRAWVYPFQKSEKLTEEG